MSCFLEELKPDKNEKTDEYYRVNNVIAEKQTHYLWQKFKKYYQINSQIKERIINVRRNERNN